MKLMRLAMCLAAFAFIGKIALSEDVDVRALQAKLAAQEARLNDLQAKVNYSEANANYAGAPEAILSINKNACVTIGGLLNTRYFYNDVKISGYDSYGWVNGYNNEGWGQVADGRANTAPLAVGVNQLDGPIPTVPGVTLPLAAQQQNSAWASAGTWGTKARAKKGDLVMADAKLRVKIDVNDYFDAWLQVDLTSSGDPASDNAEQYWIRWKNICNSGFGVKVGQDALVFGQGGYGVPSSWVAGNGDGMGRVGNGPFAMFPGTDDNGHWSPSVIPAHARWDTGRIMQVTPYWEGMDGKFKWEVSFMQKAHNDGLAQAFNLPHNGYMYRDGSMTPTWKSKNYGFGTMSSRINFSPIEGLDLQASIANFYDKAPGTWNGNLLVNGLGWNRGANFLTPTEDRFSKNNTMVDLGFKYRPCFFPKLLLWSQYIHGWNVDNLDGYDSDVINAGFAFDFTESFTFYAQGDYMRVKDGKQLAWASGVPGAPWVSSSRKATGWAGWFGFQYRLPYGVNFEAGYKYEQIKYKNYTNFANYDSNRMKATGNTFFAQVGFEF